MLDRRRHNIFKLKIGQGEPKANIAHVAGDQARARRPRQRARRRQPGVERGDRRRHAAALEDAGVDLVEQPIALRNVRAWHGSAGGSSDRDHGRRGAAWTRKRLRHRAAGRRRCVRRQDHAVGRPVSPRARSRPSPKPPASASMAARCWRAGRAPSPPLTCSRASAKLEWGTELFGPLLLTEEILTDRWTTANSASPCPPVQVSASDSTRPVFTASAAIGPSAACMSSTTAKVAADMPCTMSPILVPAD